MSTFLQWPIPAEEMESPALLNRNRFAQRFVEAPVARILDTYTKMNLAEARRLIATAERCCLGARLRGRGIELGAGTALLSCALAVRSDVEQMTAVEYVPDMVRLIQPRVIEHCLGAAQRRKVIRANGSFDELGAEDASFDFAIEIGSLHHSNDLPRTMAEIHRVLRPGGVLLAFDRVQPDHMTDAEVEALLDREYSREFLERFGYPLDRPLTRRQNGEHEYRRWEWQAAIDAAGFHRTELHRLDRMADSPATSIARLLGLPVAERNKRGRPAYELRLWLSQNLRRVPRSPVATSVLVLER
ncbi:MAG: class I SAM-dependent methyltransferase [Holophagales bacterium]|nr:class I SAM-dependent methyltransferase [Holophagales bacterium]